MCPKSDDPLTTNQNQKKFRIQVQSTLQALTGSVGIKFAGETSFLIVSSSASGDSCERSLQASGKFASVDCVYTQVTIELLRILLIVFSILIVNYYLQVSAYIRRFDVEVIEWPLYSGGNNMYSHDGNPAVTDFYCDITQTNADAACTFTDITFTELKGISIVFY